MPGIFAVFNGFRAPSSMMECTMSFNSNSNSNTNRSRPAASPRFTSVRALRRLTKAEALAQLVERPDLAANISAAARLWGVSRATVRAWLAEYAAMAVPPLPAETIKIALSALCDSIEDITPEALIDSCDDVEIIGVHGDCQMAAAGLAVAELLAEAALKRAAVAPKGAVR
jgi:hypothetical protein